MTHHPRILEGIDACRPGSDDVLQSDLSFLSEQVARDPQTRELYDRTQQIDAAVAAAFSDVPVPEGLANRTLARLSVARAESAPPNDRSTANARTAEVPASPLARRFSRRWLGAAIGMAVAAGIAVLVVNLPARPEVNKDNVSDLVLEFFEAERGQAIGQLVESQPAPQRYPFAGSILASRNVRWRRISGLLGVNGVAYDITAPGAGPQVQATLYVMPIPSTLTGLSGSPPTSPLSTTGGVAIGAWQAKGLLYVLAVSGDAKQYRLFLRADSLA